MNETNSDTKVPGGKTPAPTKAPIKKTPAAPPPKRPTGAPPSSAAPARKSPNSAVAGEKTAAGAAPIQKTIAKAPTRPVRAKAVKQLESPKKSQLQTDSKPINKFPAPTQKYPSRKTGVLRRRTIRTDTISQTLYKLSEKRTLAKYIIGISILSFLFLAVSGGYLWFWSDQNQSSAIVKAIDDGMTSLLNDQLQEARSSLQISLDRYRTYHAENPKLWWKRDAQLFIRMLRSAQGWRSLGEYKNGLLTFEAVAQHNTAGPSSWVGAQMEAELAEFFDASHWTPDEMKEMYLYLLEIPPSSWDKSDILLIRATERQGLVVFPLADRLKNANVILYGTPAPMRTFQDDSLLVNVIRYYKVDSLPETVALKLSPDLSLPARQRLLWYSEANRNCMIFAQNSKQPTLENLESVVLSEPYVVDEFNRLYND